MEFRKFMEEHRAYVKEDTTHTRIGNKGLNIDFGKYNIPQEDLQEFHKLYYNHVFIEKNWEFLTEKQIDNGPIVIDFDFRFDPSVEERQHTEETIIDIVELYCSKINDLFKLDRNTQFPITVSQKTDVVTEETKTKDGIHIFIGLNADKTSRMLLREHVLKDLGDVLVDMKLTNKYDDVIDGGVTNMSSNWMLFGSRKPGCDSYKITNRFNCKITETFELHEKEDCEFSYDEFLSLSATNRENIKLSIKDNYQDEYRKVERSQRKRKCVADSGFETSPNIVEITDETREIIHNVSAKYYESYETWIKLMWGIFNSTGSHDLCLEASRIARPDADMDDVLNILQSDSQKIISMGTVFYYSKISNEKNHTEIIAKYSQVVEKTSDWDLAMKSLQMIGDDIIKVNGKLYVYNGYKWILDDSKNISKKKIHGALKNLLMRKRRMLNERPLPDDKKEGLKQQEEVEWLVKTIYAVDSSSKQRNVMEQVMMILEDQVIDFDNNKDIFCFSNCAFNLETREKVAVPKYDYITQTVDYPYIKPTKEQLDKTNGFLNAIMPDKETLDCLKSILREGMTGHRGQYVTMLNGKGGNGKSSLMTIQRHMLGIYSYQGACETICSNISSSGANVAIAHMDKMRTCVFSEPDEKQKANTSLLKALTGNDTLNARKLFSNRNQVCNIMTLFIECNQRLKFSGRVDDALTRRLVDIYFPISFKRSAELVVGENDRLGDKYYQSQEFYRDCKVALFDILLACDKKIIIPESVTKRGEKHLFSTDDILSWMKENLDNFEEESLGDIEYVSLKSIYEKFKYSEFFVTLTAREKRDYGKGTVIDRIANSPNLAPFYREKIQNKKLKASRGNVLVGEWKKNM